MRRLTTVLAVTLLPLAAVAGEADVLAVKASRAGETTFTFHVTVRHADSGWEHHADKWDVLGPDGSILGTRVLLHPHDDEQPFTRSLSGVEIPAGVDRVTVRAHDKVHGYGGKVFEVTLPR